VVLLTGERGVGKTTVCRQVVKMAERMGLTCGGILTLADHGVRDVVDVRNGSRRRLAQVSGSGEAVIQGRFRFDPEALRWGEAVLSRATPCDLLVVDEIGPLEMERGQGWVAALDVLLAGEYRLALAVLRPEWVAQTQAELTDCAPEVVTVTRENRSELPVYLLDMLAGGQP
jgi:nucleoside-triphosphatase THEP1